MQNAFGRRSICVAIAIVLLGSATAHGKRKDLEITLVPPEARHFGSYSGDLGIALGEVRDEGFAETPRMVGVGPQAVYAVLLEGTREEVIRETVSQLLEATGLAGSPDGRGYVMDVVIRRNNFFIHQTMMKFRLRSEVFLEFIFKQDGAVAGRVLACGNSQRKTQLASKTKVDATFQEGLDDALHKLVESQTFLRLLGEGWQGATVRGGNVNMERIDRDKFYGPTDLARAQVGSAREALQGVDATTLVLQNFAMKDEKLATKEDSDPEFAVTYLPELVREHLEAFYPGAFQQIERCSDSEDAEGLVLTGDLLRFKIGSFAKRVWIGFGAGKDLLEAAVSFRDGTAGDDLFALKIVSTNWGAGFQIKKGQIRDMAEQAARDIAYLLVEAVVPDYAYPDDLEVAFDDEAYPPPAAGGRRGDLRTESG